MFEKGKYISIIVIFKGTPGVRLFKLLTHFVTSIEENYGSALKEWDGRMKKLKGIEFVIEPYLTIEQNLKR